MLGVYYLGTVYCMFDIIYCATQASSLAVYAHTRGKPANNDCY